MLSGGQKATLKVTFLAGRWTERCGTQVGQMQGRAEHRRERSHGCVTEERTS